MTQKIQGSCFTNLDGYHRAIWPHVFAAVPRVGERVESTDSSKSLRVVGVTHTQITNQNAPDTPFIRVELNQ